MRYLLIVYLTVFLAELGDKTQFAVLLYATRPEMSKLGVAVAASLALITTTAIATVIGDRLSHWVSPRYLEVAVGIGFILIGAYILFAFFKQG